RFPVDQIESSRVFDHQIDEPSQKSALRVEMKCTHTQRQFSKNRREIARLDSRKWKREFHFPQLRRTPNRVERESAREFCGQRVAHGAGNRRMQLRAIV